MQKKDPSIALLLTILCPGAGDLYIGNTNVGVKYVAGSLFLSMLVFISIFIFWPLFFLAGIPLMIAWVFRMAGIHKDCQEVNAALEEEEQKQARREKKLQAKREEVKRNTVTAASFKNGLLKIEKLKRAGVLSEEEFAHRKKTLMQELAQKKIGQDADEFVLELLPLSKNGILTEAELKQVHEVASLGMEENLTLDE